MVVDAEGDSKLLNREKSIPMNSSGRKVPAPKVCRNGQTEKQTRKNAEGSEVRVRIRAKVVFNSIIR